MKNQAHCADFLLEPLITSICNYKFLIIIRINRMSPCTIPKKGFFSHK